MWFYEVITGNTFAPPEHPGYSIVLAGNGYSGKGAGKNNPKMESVPFVGPIPRARYYIGMVFDSPKRGPKCITLSPAPDAQMFGRSGFLIHGDSKEHPGEASEGCIILPRHVRDAIIASNDAVLEVV